MVNVHCLKELIITCLVIYKHNQHRSISPVCLDTHPYNRGRAVGHLFEGRCYLII